MEKEKLNSLIVKAQAGDPEAMNELLQEAHRPISYQCRKMLKNPRDAEDMTQEIMLLVFERLDKLKEPAAFWGWVNTITVTRCINALKRSKIDLQFAEDEDGHSMLDDLEELDEQQVPDKALDNAETTRMIEEIVNGLPEAQRLCTLMHYFDEMSVREIAEVVGVPENTVKSRLNYARKAIKEQVLDYEKKGVKLYGLSPLPFLLYFLGRAAQESADAASASAMAQQVMELGASAGTAAAAGASAEAAAAGAAAAESAAAGTALSHFLGGLSAKVVAGVLAGILAVGGIAGAVVLSNREEPEPSAPPSVPVETDTLVLAPVESGLIESGPIETDANEEDPTPEDPGPPDSPYDTTTVYDPDTYISRTTMNTGLDNLEIYYEIPLFPETTGGARSINSHFKEMRDAFFRDESGEIANWLTAARESPQLDMYDIQTCMIGTYTDEITSVLLSKDQGADMGLFGESFTFTFRSGTGEPLDVPDLLGRTPYECTELLTQAMSAEGILEWVEFDPNDDVTQYPFYVAEGSVYIGVNMPSYRGDYFVRISAPLQTGGSQGGEDGGSGDAQSDQTALLSSIAYYGDPAQCAMTADQALAFAEVIRSQSAELEQEYERDKSYYESMMLPGATPNYYAALVDAGNGIPILIGAGGLTRGIDEYGVYWEYLSTFSIWQYVNGQAVQFQTDGREIAAVTRDGLWVGWNGSTPYHYEIRKLDTVLYPFQNGTISARPAHTLYGDGETNTIDGDPVSLNELDAALEGYAADIYVSSSRGGDPSGGFSGVGPAEQVLEVLAAWGGF